MFFQMLRLIAGLLFLIMVIVSTAVVYAVEVTPNVMFKRYQAPNGAQYDPKSSYRTKIESDQQILNERIFSDNQVGKLVPDINSVGLDFTFNVD